MNSIPRLLNILTISTLCIFITSCVHGGGSGGGEKDSVVITSTDALVGPGGLKTSCHGIAWFYQGQHSIGGNKLLGDGRDGKRSLIDPNEEWAGVRFIEWTPDTLNYLNSSVDECVSENSSIKNLARAFDKKSQGSVALNMSPSGAKDMFNQIFLMVENTKKSQLQATENQRKQVAADNSRMQGLRSGAIPVSNLQDAAIKLDATDGRQLVMSPKIKPDGKNYNIGGFLEKYSNSTFIATTVPVQAIGSIPFNTRFVVLVPQAFEASYQNTARVGGGIGLIGRYVGNRNLLLVTGASVTAPVFEMLYMEQK